MIIIYPPDSSTNFLSVIVSAISSQLQVSIDYPDFNLATPEDTFSSIKNYDSSRIIIYLGHGTAHELNVNNGVDTIIELGDAKRMFTDKKLILLSCYSSQFLKSLNYTFGVAIGFGNILTSIDELNAKDKLKYSHDEFRCIDIFKQELVIAFKNSIIEAYKMNFTFLQLYNSLKLRINKKISRCSLSEDITEQLVGELMFNLKSEMVLKGNSKAFLF